ncbi:transposase [Phreatobacter stygius]|uniref:Transposase n=1 Tax=Phreatobacter stygius TaxID=1940610 RepID=A0A4D7BF61_9HYPH|nr:transposase [Phreatobacter stygius]QCI67846.1 transposase [Phreatobacter stygius]
MSRLARIVAPGLPHHVTQRGNRRQRVFFEPDDYALYRDLLAQACRKADVAVWGYCLMPNHVHLILVPDASTGLARALSETHRRYTAYVNARARQTGHLFQGRFGSVALDEDHLMAAARYVSLNPVRAGLVASAQDWPWSSVRAHLDGRSDGLVDIHPLLNRVGRFADLIESETDPAQTAALRAAETIGRPVGSSAFLRDLAARLGRQIEPKKRGRRPRTADE